MDHATNAEFRREAVAMFRQVQGHPERVRAAVETYLRNGYRVGFVGEQLIDYLGVDTPCILDDAGYSRAEADAAVAIQDELHPLIFREFRDDRAECSS